LIYLDNSATTKLSSNVIARMNELMQMRLVNPSSQHSEGRRARQVVERARESILERAGAKTTGMACDQLLFTSGGTEANNLAIFGLIENKPGSIVVSSIEHPSVLAAAEQAERQGRKVIRLPVSQDGVVQIEPLHRELQKHHRGETIALVSVMFANNETGVLQPIETIAGLCREAGILVHADAVQVLGKLPLRFAGLQLDAMTVTAHKIHGPTGIGALILRNGVDISPQAFGGFQQLGLRPGTEMPVLAGGFEAAVRDASEDVELHANEMSRLRDLLQSRLQNDIRDCFVAGENALRLPHTLSIAFPGVDRQALQMALDMAGVACSTGSACASGSSQPSHVLQAMQLPAKIVQGGVRFSVSRETTSQEMESALEIIRRTVTKLRGSS
jgi:cysteine desulfurase